MQYSIMYLRVSGHCSCVILL